MGKKVPLNLTVMKQTTKWVSAREADVSEKVVMIVLNTEIMRLTTLKEMTAPRRMDARNTDASLQVVDVLEELNQAIMSLRKLKEMTAPRRMDVSMRKVMMKASAVLLEVQLMSNVMENVEAGVADALMIVKNKEKATKNVKVRGALMMMNLLTKKIITREKSTMVMQSMMTKVETLKAVKIPAKKTITREKKTTMIQNMMTVPKDSFVLPFRTDFISKSDNKRALRLLKKII